MAQEGCLKAASCSDWAQQRRIMPQWVKHEVNVNQQSHISSLYCLGFFVFFPLALLWGISTSGSGLVFLIEIHSTDISFAGDIIGISASSALEYHKHPEPFFTTWNLQDLSLQSTHDLCLREGLFGLNFSKTIKGAELMMWMPCSALPLHVCC